MGAGAAAGKAPLDLATGCFTKINTDYDAVATDATFNADCTAVAKCIHTSKCNAGERGTQTCYCGTADTSTCSTTGPAADSKCKTEFENAGRNTASIPAYMKKPSDIAIEISDLATPIGWAAFLSDCDNLYCKAECSQ